MATTRKANWEEDKHPRDHGKFTDGSSGEHGGSEDHETRANEHAAIAAGHVSSAARDIADKHVAGHEKVAEHIAALDQMHHHAAEALAALHEYSSPHNEDLDFEHHDLHEQFTETQSHLDPERTAEYASGGHQREAPVDPEDAPHLVAGYHAHPDDLPEHLRPTGDERSRAIDAHESWLNSEHHDAWMADAKAKYDAAIAPHYAEYQRRADAAQTALETLHERQIAAHVDMKEHEHGDAAAKLERMSPEKQVNEAAFSHHARDENGDILDEAAAADHSAAHDAAESMHEHATARVEEHAHHDLGDALDSLKDETRSTAAALKALGKITGRKPKLPAKTKKSANRPGTESGASVGDMATPYYRLRLKSLKFISAVDAGAQGPVANVALIKRAPSGDHVDATCHVVKLDEHLGLVFGWALASTIDGGATPHIDLQKDAVIGDDELIKVAAAFMEQGAASDVMHDDNPDGKIVFAMPLTKDVSAALGIVSKVHGLAIAMRPSPETFQRFLKKELNAFSIAGEGTRETVKAAGQKCASCGAYGKAGAKVCKGCGKAMKRASASKRTRPLRKMAVLTSVEAGHQHQIDLDDPADGWSDQLTTSFNTADGATSGHSHAWVYDEAGKITIAEDSGHNHTVDAVVPADVIRQAALNEDGERCGGCGEMCESDCRFCPKCGKAMKRGDGVPDGDRPPTPTVVAIQLSAPVPISTPPTETPTVKGDKELTAMNLEDRNRTLEAEIAQLKKMVSLTDAQRAHFTNLHKSSESDATNFLGMNGSQRDAVLTDIAKADEIVYESPFTKRVYRKSHALEIVEAAREADASKAALQQLNIAKRELEFSKRGETVLKNWPMGAKRDLRARIMKAVDAEFADAAEHEEAVKALKGADFAIEQLTVSKGVNPHNEPGDVPVTPKAQLDALTAEYAQKNNVPIHKAAVAVLETQAGAALYAKLPVGHA